MTQPDSPIRRNPVFVALDTPDLATALDLAATAGPHVGGLKVGLEFVNAQGPDGVRAIVLLGYPVFLDVKLHDIPNTVAGAVRALSRLGVEIINVHASGGRAMMEAARNAAPPSIKIVAVTILTSLDATDLGDVGMYPDPATQAVRLAKLAKSSGLDGVVCAASDLAAVRAACGPDFLTIVPGIRPAGADLGDQKRVMSPAAARNAGADILVIGRPITAAADPAAAARDVAAELELV